MYLIPLVDSIHILKLLNYKSSNRLYLEQCFKPRLTWGVLIVSSLAIRYANILRAYQERYGVPPKDLFMNPV